MPDIKSANSQRNPICRQDNAV